MKKRFFGPASPVAAPSGLLESHAAAKAALLAVLQTSEGPMHDPPLEPRDETVFLLIAAAEIEHALMVQYLYAAYSLRVSVGPNVRLMQDLVLQIAREEMGHLITVQNLLQLLGGPFNFNREHSPYASEIYPFRFKLEPITLDSLAKYVIAESPDPLPATLPPEDLELLAQIKLDARRSNDGQDVMHVGPIFARLKNLLEDSARGVRDEDFRLDTGPLQADFNDWGFEPRTTDVVSEQLIIEAIKSTDVNKVRAAAVQAVDRIAKQGEGFDLPTGSPPDTESHFERFFEHIYKPFRVLIAAGENPTLPVTENPNTTFAPEQPPSMMKMLEVIEEAHATKGRITNRRARAWAHLFNLRYRLLLAFLSHFMRLNQPELYVPTGARQGDRTERGLLLIWTFNEMRRLKKIAGKLVQLPKDEPPGQTLAGPPFELPYTLNLPEREADRWRAHLDASRAAVRLVRTTLQPGEPNEDEFLTDLVRLDEQDQVILQSLASGRGIPAGSLPNDFPKVVAILEESVRGFDILSDTHANFWDRQTRDEFINKPPPAGPGSHIIHHNDDGTFDPDKSPLMLRLREMNIRRRMPRLRPPVPPPRIEFIHEWIRGGCVDSSGRPGIMRERNPKDEPAPPTPTPAPIAPLSFATDIRGLFRVVPDRSAMVIFGLDLHKFEDVRDRADDILARLNDGSMPCDGSWPPDRIAKFQKWIDDGKQP